MSHGVLEAFLHHFKSLKCLVVYWHLLSFFFCFMPACLFAGNLYIFFWNVPQNVVKTKQYLSICERFSPYCVPTIMHVELYGDHTMVYKIFYILVAFHVRYIFKKPVALSDREFGKVQILKICKITGGFFYSTCMHIKSIHITSFWSIAKYLQNDLLTSINKKCVLKCLQMFMLLGVYSLQ